MLYFKFTYRFYINLSYINYGMKLSNNWIIITKDQYFMKSQTPLNTFKTHKMISRLVWESRKILNDMAECIGLCLSPYVLRLTICSIPLGSFWTLFSWNFSLKTHLGHVWIFGKSSNSSEFCNWSTHVMNAKLCFLLFEHMRLSFSF